MMFARYHELTEQEQGLPNSWNFITLQNYKTDLYLEKIHVLCYENAFLII